MSDQEAKRIGSTQALKAVGIGILIAQLIMTLLCSDNGILKGMLWFTDINYKLNLLVGIIIMIMSGYYYGQKSGVEILIEKRKYKWVGVKYGIITLLTTAFLTSWVGFFQQGVRLIGSDDNPFEDYIYKPVFWIFITGIVPVILVGFWFGKQIEKHQPNYYMENKYEIILYWSKEDGAVIVEVPELVGCIADGENYNQALKNVETVITQWIQTAIDLGREIPLPKGKLMYA